VNVSNANLWVPNRSASHLPTDTRRALVHRSKMLCKTLCCWARDSNAGNPSGPDDVADYSLSTVNQNPPLDRKVAARETIDMFPKPRRLRQRD